MKLKEKLMAAFVPFCLFCGNASAKGQLIALRVPMDSTYYEESAHGKDKLPARRHELPMVDYDAEARTFTFVCHSRQRVAYWLKARGSEERTACKELQLVPGTPVEVPVELPAQGVEGWLLYVRVGSVLYVGESE